MRHHDYVKLTTNLALPVRKWTFLGDVRAVPRRDGLYVAQFAVHGVAGRRGALQVKFARQRVDGSPLDGTGDQDFCIPRGLDVFNVSHSHIVGGFRGRMQTWAWINLDGCYVDYRILKAVK